MRDEAEKRIGHLYPKVRLAKELGGKEATVIAWLWARTVKCPNPACGATMPLVRSFVLSTKKGKEAWVEPVVNQRYKTIRFDVNIGKGEPPEGTVNRKGGRCVACGQAVTLDHIRSEGKAGRMDAQLMAIVAAADSGRVYVSGNEEHVEIASKAKPWWKPDAALPKNPRDFKTPNYGMNSFGDLFTPRQLVALTTFNDLVSESRELALQDAIDAGFSVIEEPLHQGGGGAIAYADAVATYLAFAVDRAADYWSSICSWHAGRDIIRNTFGRQAIPMIWDCAEGSPFSDSTGNWVASVDWTSRVIANQSATVPGKVSQLDATAISYPEGTAISTDPPYYDNIGYADLSDFFYVWLRRALKNVHPDVFATLLVPKEQELIANPYRFEGSSERSKEFFEEGFTRAFRRMRLAQPPEYPFDCFLCIQTIRGRFGQWTTGSCFNRLGNNA